MSNFPYSPGDARLVDQIVYELKSKGIFDQFRKECISDVDTRPAYQNLRQRVESSVSSFLSRQRWRPDLNKNQLREKLRKHILDGNYLEQGVERIVDQVVNPKVASVFIPKVEDLVYSHLGIKRRKSAVSFTEKLQVKTEDLLPNDLEAVSPDSVKSHDVDINKCEPMDTSDIKLPPSDDMKMEISEDSSKTVKDEEFESPPFEPIEKKDLNEASQESHLSGISDLTSHDSNDSFEKKEYSKEDMQAKLSEIPEPDDNQGNTRLSRVSSISNLSIDIPLPDEIPAKETSAEKEDKTKLKLISDGDSSSDSSLRRNVSPLTPIRNFNNENSCDAQQAFEETEIGNEISTETKSKFDKNHKEEIFVPISTFRFTIESKDSSDSNIEPPNSNDIKKIKSSDNLIEKSSLTYQFQNQINLNSIKTPVYEDSSSSNNLHIDYESDANHDNCSKLGTDSKTGPEPNAPFETPLKVKDRISQSEEKKSSHKSSHRSRDSHHHSSQSVSKERISESKSHSSSRDRKDSHRSDKKSSKDDLSKSKAQNQHHSTHRESSRDRTEKSRSDSSRSRNSSSHKNSNSHRDSKSHKTHSSSSSHRHSSSYSSSRRSDDRKSSSNREKTDEKQHDESKEPHGRSKDNRKSTSRDHSRHSSTHRAEKERLFPKHSDSKSKYDKDSNKKDDKKDKKVTDDHYSSSGRGNHTRRSTDRDSNDGNSSSSKGSHFLSGPKSSDDKATSADKGTTSKSENSSSSSETNGQSDLVDQVNNNNDSYISATEAVHSEENLSLTKPVIRIESQLKTPIADLPNLLPVLEKSVKKPMIAANIHEARKLMKMRKLIDIEQKKKQQEAALLLELHQNVKPNVSQVFSGISGPELEFACVANKTKENFLNTTESTQRETKMEHDKKSMIGNKLVDSKVQNEAMMVKNEATQSCENVSSIEEILSLAHESNNVSEGVKVYEIVTEVTCEEAYESDTQGCIIEELSVADVKLSEENKTLVKVKDVSQKENLITETILENNDFLFFGEQEKYNAEVERDKFQNFLEKFIIKYGEHNKLYLMNCNSYEENVFKKVCNDQFNFDIINYKCENLVKIPALNKNVAKNLVIHLEDEINLPVGVSTRRHEDLSGLNNKNSSPQSPIFSPLKSECSFDLSSDYDSKIEEMVNKASRQEIMEIILGAGVPNGSPSKMPTIDYCSISICTNEEFRDLEEASKESLKRKFDVEGSKNNNHKVLTPNKIRKLSLSDQITSTTEETEDLSTESEASNNRRSKYTGKARRVGLPKPKTPSFPKSPSSDKSVENYLQMDQQASPKNGLNNGKVLRAKVQRNKVQRYETSDLYKPKLHFLSRRNNVS